MKSFFRFFSILFFFCQLTVVAQDNDRIRIIEQNIQELSKSVQSLNDSIDISVNGVELQEFVRALAISNKVNISIDPGLTYPIVNNFSNVQFKNVLLFLIKEYNLEVQIIGNIISLSKYVTPEVPKPKPSPRNIDITYSNELLSYDLISDTLYKVTKKITQLTGQNIIVSSELKNTTVSGFIQNMPVNQAFQKLCIANGLTGEKSKDGSFVISDQSASKNSENRGSKSSTTKSTSNEDTDYLLDIKIVDLNNISITALNAPLDSIFKQVSNSLKVNYHILSPLEGTETMILKNVSYDNLLDLLTNGKDIVYKRDNDIILIGQKKIQELSFTKVIHLQYRTIEGLKAVFPKSVISDLEVIEFAELNSFLVSGSETKVNEFVHFINEVDKLVPVILIELIIIDYQKFHNHSVGIDAGISEDVSSKLSVLPGLEATFTSKSINKLLSSLNGWGWFNLGKVTENFYISLKALEENGIVNIQSTPRLSTLNGHEAKLTNGETRYYYEEQSSLISNQSVYQNQTKTYKSVNADLSITILPIVSGDDQITIKIEVEQSDFKDPESEGAPPGSINRSFSSFIRIKDQEMILLGGLENERKSDTGSGIPFLSRIPVLKWIFSSRTKIKSESKLNIFIKPTVIN